ncbi:DUF4097 domain-containing protein [Candidatus Fermentibacteria bacterium]|nr:DUF4097 domain-containing protein [Candidatus Fermentibacteria bacterium]
MTGGFARMTAAALAAVMLAGGCDQVREIREMGWPMEPGSTVSVSSFNGEIMLTEADTDSILVTATLSSWEGRSSLEDVEIVFTPGPEASLAARGKNGNVSAGVSLAVTVPGGTGLDRVETSNGSITVEGLHGDAELSTSNGAITVTGFKGAIVASSSNGDITITRHGGRVSAETSNGDIVIEGEGALLTGASTSNGQIVAALSQVPGSGLVLETSNAGITVTVSGDFPAEFRMDTSNGSVIVSGEGFASIDLDKDEGIAIIGDGGPVVILDTSNGDITLTRL